MPYRLGTIALITGMLIGIGNMALVQRLATVTLGMDWGEHGAGVMG